MSIIGEFVHGLYAKDLAKMLITAATDPKWSNCRSCVKGFMKENVLPLYLNALSSSEGEAEMDPIIKKEYYL